MIENLKCFAALNLTSYQSTITPRAPEANVFGNERHWDNWLCKYRESLETLIVDIETPSNLTAQERSAIQARLSSANMVVYRCSPSEAVNRNQVAQLAEQFGLVNPTHNLFAADDGLSEIEAKANEHSSQYIPYTNRALNWHTDGYYRSHKNPVRAMLLHCVRPAETGGSLEAIDARALYGLLHQQDHRFTEALRMPDVMWIPENQAHGANREASLGPVFFFENDCLQMRYTARKHNVVWKNTSLISEAKDALEEYLEDPSIRFRYQLQAGEGLLSANIPHRREPFFDSDDRAGRLIYRGRYAQPISTEA